MTINNTTNGFIMHNYAQIFQKRINHSISEISQGFDTRCIAFVGEAGSGKTFSLKHSSNQYPQIRKEAIYITEYLLVTVPSKPTVKAMAITLLSTLGDPLCHRGTEVQLTLRLKHLLKKAQTKIIALDEFQHFVDQGTHKIQHHVADWLKVLIDDTGVGLVIAGLPHCLDVIRANPQLQRRFQRPLIMPRFNWSDSRQKIEFINILGAFQDSLTPLDLPELKNEEMAYRWFCATGGLIGRVSNLCKEIRQQAAGKKNKSVNLLLIRKAARQANFDLPKGTENPFSDKFNTEPNKPTIQAALNLGKYQSSRGIEMSTQSIFRL